MEPIKAGTRCECRDADSRCPHVGSVGCYADAVRMLVVPWGTQWCDNKFANVPMCAACAEYHEKKAGKP